VKQLHAAPLFSISFPSFHLFSIFLPPLVGAA
jgi:hypothetical protein